MGRRRREREVSELLSAHKSDRSVHIQVMSLLHAPKLVLFTPRTSCVRPTDPSRASPIDSLMQRQADRDTEKAHQQHRHRDDDPWHCLLYIVLRSKYSEVLLFERTGLRSQR